MNNKCYAVVSKDLNGAKTVERVFSSKGEAQRYADYSCLAVEERTLFEDAQPGWWFVVDAYWTNNEDEPCRITVSCHQGVWVEGQPRGIELERIAENDSQWGTSFARVPSTAYLRLGAFVRENAAAKLGVEKIETQLRAIARSAIEQAAFEQLFETKWTSVAAAIKQLIRRVEFEI